MAYRFIQKYSYLFGVRYLLRRLNIYPNAYYNYVKNRKKESIQEKENIKNKIKEIYYSNNGILGYRQGELLPLVEVGDELLDIVKL